MLSERNILRGEKVRLAAHRKDDAATYASWHDNSWYSRLLDTRPADPQPPGRIEDWIEDAEKSSRIYSFAIRTVEDDRLVGIIELEGIDWSNSVGWLGVAIGQPEDWGRGFGSEAIALALKFGFHELNLHRIQLTVFDYNARAITAYEKLGFVREGTFRERIHRDGERFDQFLYGLLRHEWEARQLSA